MWLHCLWLYRMLLYWLWLYWNFTVLALTILSMTILDVTSLYDYFRCYCIGFDYFGILLCWLWLYCLWLYWIWLHYMTISIIGGTAWIRTTLIAKSVIKMAVTILWFINFWFASNVTKEVVTNFGCQYIYFGFVDCIIKVDLFGWLQWVCFYIVCDYS